MGTEHAEELIEQSPDAVIFANTEGVITVWNAAAERVFGHSADTAIGQNLDMIIPEQFRAAHWKGFDRALGDGVTKYQGQVLPTRALRADGETIYVELGFAIVHAGGAVIGALATARDITERFNRDRDMRRKLQDYERADRG